MTDLIPPDLIFLDHAALGWFLLAWLGYGQLIHRLRSITMCETIEADRRDDRVAHGMSVG